MRRTLGITSSTCPGGSAKSLSNGMSSAMRHFLATLPEACHCAMRTTTRQRPLSAERRAVLHGGERPIGIDDAAADHGEHRDDRADLPGRYREIVFAEHRQIGL